MIRVGCTLALCASLAACAAPAAPSPVPTLIGYSAADYAALEAEAKGPMTLRWLEDYVALRDQVRQLGVPDIPDRDRVVLTQSRIPVRVAPAP